MRSIAAAALVATVVTGCSSNSHSTASSKGSLTYWSMWKQGEPQQQVLQKAIDAFTAKTGIKVNAQWSGRDVVQQIIPRLSAGTAPDLFDQDGGPITAQFAPVDGVLGLTDVYNTQISGEANKISDVVAADLVSQYRTKSGQPTIVPYEIVGAALWYNELRNPDLATSAPTTWSQFTSTLDKLKAKGDSPIAVDGDVPGYEAYWLLNSIIRHGGVGTLNKAASDKSGRAFDDPAILSGAKDVLSLIKGGYLPAGFTGTKWPTQQTGWADGSNKSDFLFMGTWAPSETGGALEKEGKNVSSIIKYRSVAYPTVGGGKGNSALEADAIGFAIPSKAKNPGAAKQFIEFFMNKDNLSGISTTARNLTPRTDIPAPTELTDFAKQYAGAGGQLFTDTDGLALTQPKWISSVWSPLVQDLFNQKYGSAEDFVAALKSKTADFYKSNG